MLAVEREWAWVAPRESSAVWCLAPVVECESARSDSISPNSYRTSLSHDPRQRVGRRRHLRLVGIRLAPAFVALSATLRLAKSSLTGTDSKTSVDELVNLHKNTPVDVFLSLHIYKARTDEFAASGSISRCTSRRSS